MPQLYWIIPLEGGQIDNSLPGGRPPHVGGGPIYHPGHPSHGLPSGGHGSTLPIYHPGHPEHGLPSNPAHISNWVPGSGSYPSGQPVPPDTINPPLPAYLPEPYDDKVIVAIKRPDVTEWRVTAYDAGSFPSQGLPPTPEPK
jgi:hypothetical protein